VEEGPVNHVVVDTLFDPNEKEGTFDNRRWSTLPDDRLKLGDDDDYKSGMESGYASTVYSDGVKPSRGVELVKSWLSENVYLPLRLFFDMGFPEKDREDSFQKERWYANKPGAVLGALFLIFYWGEWAPSNAADSSRDDGHAGLVQPLDLLCAYPGKTCLTIQAYIGIMGFFVLPMAVFVVFNGPRKFNIIYQIWAVGACWIFDVSVCQVCPC
jgi:hypothetical protein